MHFVEPEWHRGRIIGNRYQVVICLSKFYSIFFVPVHRSKIISKFESIFCFTHFNFLWALIFTRILLLEVLNWIGTCNSTYINIISLALLSWPFQQLPRYVLLLDSLLKSIKKINETHDDIPNLQSAVAGIKKVTATVNDKKQQADEHLAMFDIFSQIENAPNQIISAQRHYQFRFNCTAAESSQKLGVTKGTKLCMLVFR